MLRIFYTKNFLDGLQIFWKIFKNLLVILKFKEPQTDLKNPYNSDFWIV